MDKEELESIKFFSNEFPKERLGAFLPTGDDWVVSKRNLDRLHEISGLDPKQYPNLWRVHDDIYDFSNFDHPGGRDFFDITVGTDVTELFESSHPNIEKARAFLGKYKISLPKEKLPLPPRNTQRLLFEPTGFYCTLRKRIHEVLKTLPPPSYLHSTSFVLDSLLLGHLLTEVLCILPQLFPAYSSEGTTSVPGPVSFVLAMLSGFLLACLANCSHNFWHLRNNWRMYTFDLTCYSSHEWRITHAYSHHTYPNSVLDYEVWAFEPILYFLPTPAKTKQPTILPILFILLVFPIGMIISLIKRIRFLVTGVAKFRWEHVLPIVNGLGLICLRYYLSGVVDQPESFGEAAVFVLKRLLLLHSSCSFLFFHLGLAGAHHHPNIWHAGDTPTDAVGVKQGIDFGIYQLIAVSHRPTIDESLFLSSITFGRHGLHHMFPTIDLCVLPALLPTFNQTCKDFHVEYFIDGDSKDANHQKWPKHRSFGIWDGWTGMIRQTLRAKSDVSNFPPLETMKTNGVAVK